MNSTHLGKLLVLNLGVRSSFPSGAREAGVRTCPLRHLIQPKPIRSGPVLPALAGEGDGPSRGRMLTVVVLVGLACLGLGFVIAAGLFVFGIERVHHVRQEYQLSLQLKQREGELHQAQRAYQSLTAYLAMQQARESELASVQRVSFVPTTARASNSPRISPIPATKVQPSCSKRSSTDV